MQYLVGTAPVAITISGFYINVNLLHFCMKVWLYNDLSLELHQALENCDYRRCEPLGATWWTRKSNWSYERVSWKL